jgi:transcriptional regulator with XRE-family HTH domain
MPHSDTEKSRPKVLLSSIISRRLAEVREERGLTLRVVAANAGLEAQRLSLYESGEQEPPLKTLLRIARVLEVPVDALVRGEPPDFRLLQRFRQIEALEEQDRDAAIALLDVLLGYQRYLQERRAAPPETAQAPQPPENTGLRKRFRQIEQLGPTEREAALPLLDLLLGLLRL